MLLKLAQVGRTRITRSDDPAGAGLVGCGDRVSDGDNSEREVRATRTNSDRLERTEYAQSKAFHRIVVPAVVGSSPIAHPSGWPGGRGFARRW